MRDGHVRPVISLADRRQQSELKAMPFGYCIGHITVDDPDAYRAYAEKDPATIALYGGEYLVRGGQSDVKEGDFPGARTVVIRFPSFEAANAWYHGAEYSAIRPIREAVASGALMIVEGV
ncbi:MAG: DUF1330 domain-containing protein [Paracoccaceae bacterium]|nr:DUF1330 domain-containing protein [Paracoccaceae bacterium]